METICISHPATCQYPDTRVSSFSWQQQQPWGKVTGLRCGITSCRSSSWPHCFAAGPCLWDAARATGVFQKNPDHFLKGCHFHEELKRPCLPSLPSENAFSKKFTCGMCARDCHVRMPGLRPPFTFMKAQAFTGYGQAVQETAAGSLLLPF